MPSNATSSTSCFQPIVSMGHSEVLGFEALVRWAHPSLGVLLPKLFIPVAEESDLIGEIGSWVLEDALRQLVTCRAVPGFAHLTVAVNLSALQLRDELLVQRVAAPSTPTVSRARRSRSSSPSPR